MNNAYAVADLLLTLVSIGIRAEAIRSDLNALKASGKTDDEVRAHLRQMCDAELDKLKESVK